MLRNYLNSRRVRIEPIVTHVLDQFTDYVEAKDACTCFNVIPDADSLIDQLIEYDILLLEGSEGDIRDRQIQETWRWCHAARFFHFGTRNVPYEQDPKVQRESLLNLMHEEPPTGPYKLVDAPATPLEGKFSGLEHSLGDTLRERRTRRNFSRDPISFEHFGCVLRWVWGQTHYKESSEIGSYVLKTSPSGGARHSIEVYPLVARVQGLQSGVYHYSVRDHALKLIRPGLADEELTRIFVGQTWLRDASAICVMASRIARGDWKYRHSHAYRVLLLDAGHLGQTFHLVCTSLGLAPFTLAGFNDSLLEKTLAIDGINEVVLYAAAFGRPADP